MVTAVKTNPDYSASAVMLVNNPKVGIALFKLQAKRALNDELLNKMEDCIPDELKTKRGELLSEMIVLEKELKTLIETEGSYQDVEHGSYAVKQAKHTVSFEPALVRDNLTDQYANMVIVEAVDKVKLEGLVKGGFIDQSVANKCGIAKISYVFIIK